MSSDTPVLVVEDDQATSRMLASYLEEHGYEVLVCASASAALKLVCKSPVSVIVLDVMLPDGDGFELCRHIRAGTHQPDVPILMLTARGEDTDRIVGLEIGADDYLAKPFNPRELLARLRAILRRTSLGPIATDPVWRFGSLEIEPLGRKVRLDGRGVELTGYQFDLLIVLAKSAGRVLSRDHLHDIARGEPLGSLDRRIDIQISRLRAAIETDPRNPKRIVTVRGVGYVFARHDDLDES